MRAAHGLVHDFVDQAQGLQAMRGDAQRLGRIGRAIGGFPEDGGTALGADHREHRVLQHQHLIGHANGQSATGAPLTNDGGDDGHFELGHFKNVAANGFALPALFGIDAGISARGVHKGEHGQLEFLGGFHQAQGLAIALGPAHAKVAQGSLFGVAAFLVAQHHARRAVESGHAAHNALVVREVAVAVHLHKVGEDVVEVIQRVGPLGVARNFGDLPRRQIGVDVFGELDALFGELVDFGRNVHGRIALHIAQLLDLVFQVGDGLLKVEKHFFSHSELQIEQG